MAGRRPPDDLSGPTRRPAAAESVRRPEHRHEHLVHQPILLPGAGRAAAQQRRQEELAHGGAERARDGEHIVINTVAGFQKVRNVERDPRVAVTIADPQDVSTYFSVRGRVVDITPKGGTESIEELAQKYLGGPYPWFGGRDQVRVILTIAVEKIVHAPWG
ncbi:pyridoxamine 5'-phosphate oxidase family protein [Actinoplanes sp. NPDC049599]|uniref:pyridoxamine 5'-phosphate oxidase family protein n=1 Tax=Actinoplanes sp. NPDC049599 TaxID=3363903 RepID=UPI0037A0A530